MRPRSTIPALLLLGLACILLTGPVGADDRPKDKAAIRELVKAFETTHNKHDAKAFAALFSLDGDFTNVLGMTAHGRKAIEEIHRPLFEGDTSKGNPSFKNAIVTIDGVKVRFLRPDVASVDIFWTQTGSVAPDGKERGTRKGLATWVVTREKGIWEVDVMHNMDLPVNPPAKPKQ